MEAHYLSDRNYHRLVPRLIAAHTPDKVKTVLGDAGIWPASVKADLERSERLAPKARKRIERSPRHDKP
jgi:hypothetical protein